MASTMKEEQEVKPVRGKGPAPGSGEETISSQDETEGQTRDPVETPDSDPRPQRVGREAPRRFGKRPWSRRREEIREGALSRPWMLPETLKKHSQ